ncbi:hypothetical protein TRVL_05062 [Trypanosoma vivax]|nr:hypothetical protein TRVL_05062 [Trypanosoma vivax]
MIQLRTHNTYVWAQEGALSTLHTSRSPRACRTFWIHSAVFGTRCAPCRFTSIALALEASAVFASKSCVTLRLRSVTGAGMLIHNVNQVTQHAHARLGLHAECESGLCISLIGYPLEISFNDTRGAFDCATKRFSSQSF